MKAVGIRELKNRLSEYLRLVRGGEEVVVTDRGEVVAELKKPGCSLEEVPYPGLLELARRGGARLGAPNRPDLYPTLSRLVADGEVEDLLDAERGPALNLYAESSAVLAWLLGEGRSETILKSLASADLVLVSDLTLIECDRALIRATATSRIKEADAADRRARLRKAAEHWTILRLGEEIVERARRPFPAEPLRTLDAIHLAAAVTARGVVPETALLSLDERIRACATELGFSVVPE